MPHFQLIFPFVGDGVLDVPFRILRGVREAAPYGPNIQYKQYILFEKNLQDI